MPKRNPNAPVEIHVRRGNRCYLFFPLSQTDQDQQTLTLETEDPIIASWTCEHCSERNTDKDKRCRKCQTEKPQL